MDEAALDLILARLNPQQRAAASAGMDPLLIVAGAGTGKTTALVHRVAWLIARGVDPSRVLLLTFTRRAASEMLRRVDGVLRELPRPLATCDVAAAEGGTSLNSNVPAEVSRASPSGGMANTSSRVWGGTFHAVANRLLRRFGQAVGLPPGFSVHDQSDSEDLLNVIRTELGLTKKTSRFPNKSTCLAIYSRCVNAREKLEKVLQRDFYWCKEWRDELSRLFDAYVDRKEAAAVLDYDDLLLYWHALLADEVAGEAIRRMFDCVLVDEYQDTNLLQAEIVYRL
ncbi:MAG: UvrD-helicase domain-containing protein, partial [Planctomycetota bacterium]